MYTHILLCFSFFGSIKLTSFFYRILRLIHAVTQVCRCMRSRAHIIYVSTRACLNVYPQVELHLNDHEKDEKVKALLVSRIQSKEEHIRKLNELISLKTDEFERSTTNSKIDLQSAHSRLKQVEADHAALSAQLKKIKGSLRLKEKESAGLTSSVNQLEYGNRELSKELQLDRSEKDLLKKRLAEILHNQDISAEAQTR